MAGLEPRLHVGEAVLELLVRRQRPSERVAVEGPLEGHVEGGLHGSDGLRGGHHEGELELSADLAGGFPDLAHHGLGGYAHVVEDDPREPSGEIDRVHRLDRDSRGVGRHQHLGQPSAAAAGDEEVARLGRRFDRSLHAADRGLRTLDPDLDRHVAEPVVRPGLAVAPRRDLRPVEQTGEQPLAGDVGVVAQGGGDEVGRYEGARGGVAPELVGHEREVDDAVAADRAATVLPGDEQGGEPQLGAATPEVGDEAGRVVPEPPELGDGRLLPQEPRGGVPEELLICAQVQQHVSLCPSVRSGAASTSLPSISILVSGSTIRVSRTAVAPSARLSHYSTLTLLIEENSVIQVLRNPLFSTGAPVDGP